MKSKELKVYNLPYERGFLSQINARPTYILILLIIVGVALLFFDIPAAYGAALIVAGITCLCFTPKTTLMEFYENYFVLFNRVDRESCFIAYYDDVKFWHYSWSPTKDYLNIEFNDGSIEKIETFSKPLFETYMNKYLKDKHQKNK